MQRKFVGIPPEISDYLTKSKINITLTGHQPCDDYPAILRSHSDQVVFINGDTGYANAHAQNIHNTRGSAAHTLQIFTGENTHIEINARLLDGQYIPTHLEMNEQGIVNKTHVGKLLPNNELVQCQLPNGNYRIIHQENFLFVILF